VKTPITELVGIGRPVVQAGMHHVGHSTLAPAVSNAGGTGLLAG
jgi:NAD(P)H-dependent flavin oxidoreductase YrpB (nitropropane dioxygenase family)